MSKQWQAAAVVSGCVLALVAIPLGAILLAGAASGYPVIEPLRPYAWPALRFVLVAAGLGAVLLLVWRALGPERTAVLRKRWKEWRWSAVAAQGFAVSILAMVMVAAVGPLSLIDHSWVILVMLAFGIMSAASRRIGNELFCASCGYEQVGASLTPDEREDRCPECGAYWRRPGGVIKGRKDTSRAPIIAGVALLVVALGWHFGRIAYPQLEGAQMAIVPTGVLISGVVDGRPGRNTAIKVLANRNLSREQELRLMMGLLDKRTRGEGLFGDERDWLEAAFTSGQLPPDLVERFFADELKVEIYGPPQAYIGEEVNLGLLVRHRGTNFGRVHDMYVAFAGYSVEGEDNVRERRDAPIYASQFGRIRPKFGADRGPRSPAANPEYAFRAVEPGVLRVRAVLWLYAVPHRTPGAFTWMPDGTPALPPNTMWRERIDLWHEIEILP